MTHVWGILALGFLAILVFANWSVFGFNAAVLLVAGLCLSFMLGRFYGEGQR